MATTVDPPQEIAPSASEDAVMDESEEAKSVRAVKQGSPPTFSSRRGASDSPYSRILLRGFQSAIRQVRDTAMPSTFL